MQKGFEGVFTDYQTLLDRIRSGYDSSFQLLRQRSLPHGAG